MQVDGLLYVDNSYNIQVNTEGVSRVFWKTLSLLHLKHIKWNIQKLKLNICRIWNPSYSRTGQLLNFYLR